MSVRDPDKRTFIRVCLGGVATLAAVGVAAVTYPLFRYYLVPKPSSSSGGKTSIGINEIAVGDAKFFDYNGTAAVVLKKQDGTIVALSAVCPHLGCIVQWEKDRQDFLCPCHAGYFTPDGVVISGPPPRALEKLPFAVTNGMITVG